MNNIQGPKRQNNARARQMARKRRRQERAELRKQRPNSHPERTGTLTKPRRWLLMWQDLRWHMAQGRWLQRVTWAVLVVVPLVYMLSLMISNKIYPNVHVMGVNIGRLSPEQARDTLQQAWLSEISIDMMVEGETIDTLSPAQLGLQFDAAATVEAARDMGFRIGLVQTSVPPVVTLTDSGYLSTQEYLLNMAEQVNIRPFNPGFEWQGDTLVGIPGKPGRLLDIAPTMAALQESPAAVVQLGEFTIFTSPVQPEAQDPTPYLNEVQRYASETFTLSGYDPFTDEFMNWTTDRDTFTSWLEVNGDGLSLRETVFAPFMEAQTASLNPDTEEEVRFINTEETINRVRDAIAARQSSVDLRIRYQPHQYVVQPGDTASKIARKTGIPFYLIQQQNAGRDLNVLSIGDTLNMPTRDVTMPHEPVPHKRIVVNLETQELWAFEDDQMVFNWSISSGRSNAPTSPGIYQIISHSEVASGSSYTLCDDIGCGQWEMSWFMGIYEVVPGLVNGFHGAVLLPNGGYLNGGATGFPSTFGCVMSQDDNAQKLYEWAERGTVVEIISSEFDPVSPLAQQTQEL